MVTVLHEFEDNLYIIFQDIPRVHVARARLGQTLGGLSRGDPRQRARGKSAQARVRRQQLAQAHMCRQKIGTGTHVQTTVSTGIEDSFQCDVKICCKCLLCFDGS